MVNLSWGEMGKGDMSFTHNHSKIYLYEEKRKKKSKVTRLFGKRCRKPTFCGKCCTNCRGDIVCVKETSNVHHYNKGRLATFKCITIILLQLFTTHRSGLINIFSWLEICGFIRNLPKILKNFTRK